MRWIHRLQALWRSLAGRRALEEELSRDLRFHIDQLARELESEGHSPALARRLAHVAVGRPERALEAQRDLRRLPLVEVAWQDLRYAARGMRRQPAFAAVAILSLAIGIGANTAIFSIVNTVILRPLPFADPERLYSAHEILPRLTGTAFNVVNPTHAREWASAPSIEAIGTIRPRSAQLRSGGDPVALPSLDVTHNLFTMLGVEPLFGRPFTADEEIEGRDRVVMLHETLWRSRFNADPGILGRTISIDSQLYQVIGVMPASFGIPRDNRLAQIGLFRPLVLTADEQARRTGNYNYPAFVRLRQGATAQGAVAEMNAILERIKRETHSTSDAYPVLRPLHDLVTGDLRAGLWMLAAGVSAVLLIVCVNLANLLLTKITSRHREAAIRAALGASRARQVGHVLAESLLLSVSGGALGLVFAHMALTALVASGSIDMPRLALVRLDPSVLAFALSVTMVTGILFGLLPSWRFAARANPQEALGTSSRTVTEGRAGMRLRNLLIGVEVCLSAALLVVAGLLASSLTRLVNVDKGFDDGHTVTASIGLIGDRYQDENARGQVFDRLLANAAAIPGVEAAGLTTALPTTGRGWGDAIYLEGGTRYSVDNRYTSPGYFKAMHIGMKRGRLFEEADRGNHVAVLSEKAVKLLWPNEPNPIGLQFMGEDDKIKTLVGTVAEVRANLADDPPPMAYYPYWQRMPAGATFVVRGTGDTGLVASAFRDILRAEDPQLPLPVMRDMAEVVDVTLASRRFQARLMLAFGAAALLVASLGIYGVVSYSVARRRNEIGIRMALGAERGRLFGLVLRQGMTPVFIGLAGGIALALGLGHAIRGLLFEVQPTDPLTIAVVVAVLTGVGALACLIPARRAAKINEIVALRHE